MFACLTGMLLLLGQAHAQIVFHDAAQFPLLGKAAGSTASRYERFPDSLEHAVRPVLWKLSRNTAGMAIRFRSNSTRIVLKWESRYNNHMNHMTDTGVRGLDLYCWEGKDGWRFVNSARPGSKKSNQATVIANMTPAEREYMLYLPLYIGLMVFLLRAVKESMSSSRTNDERRRAMHLVFTDPMTGLLNRRALANRLSHIGKAGMDGDLHIIMFDIDGMKDCNDRFGHVMGDKLIQSFAESLKQASADLDKYIFRYGGDEFLMIVYENGPFDSDKVIASVRDCFAQLTPTGKSGFSAGYSRLDAATREDLEVKLREADTRMYYEKMRRRSKEGTHQ